VSHKQDLTTREQNTIDIDIEESACFGSFVQYTLGTTIDSLNRRRMVSECDRKCKEILRQGRDAIAGHTSREYGPSLIAELPVVKKEGICKKETVEATRTFAVIGTRRPGGPRFALGLARRRAVAVRSWPPPLASTRTPYRRSRYPDPASWTSSHSVPRDCYGYHSTDPFT
jgi:hypothetical protein